MNYKFNISIITIFEQLSHLLCTLKIDILEQLLERRLGLEKSARCAGQSHNYDVVGGFSLGQPQSNNNSNDRAIISQFHYNSVAFQLRKL